MQQHGCRFIERDIASTLKSSISEGETGGLSVREPLRGPLL